jgi:hypothetical protein
LVQIQAPLTLFFGLDDLLPSVGTALRANPMWQYGFMTFRAKSHVGHLYMMMGPAHISPGFGFLLLGYGHFSSLVSFDF